MWPPEHFVFAFLPFLVYTVFRYRRFPSGHTILLVLAGSQLPDLIDKPLAWTFAVIPSGRMLAHSIVISGPVLGLGCLLALRFGWARYAVLFSFSYLSHLVGDFYPIALVGREYYFFPNLFWPLLEANPDRAPSFTAHIPEDPSSLLLPFAIFGVIMCYAVADVLVRFRRRRQLNSPPL